MQWLVTPVPKWAALMLSDPDTRTALGVSGPPEAGQVSKRRRKPSVARRRAVRRTAPLRRRLESGALPRGAAGASQPPAPG